jgi:TRAP-type C4-dicarboxylate transport system permease small subunit
MFFLNLPHAIWSNHLIRSEFIIDRVNLATKAILLILYDLLSAIFFFLLFLSNWSDTITAWRILDYEGEGALRVPTYPVYTLILLGCILGSALFTSKFIVRILNLYLEGRES